MSIKKDLKGTTKLPSLTDEDIVTLPVDRRSFLARVGVVGSATAFMGAGFLTSGCKQSDDCDTDVARADADPFDPVRQGNPCDAD